MYGFFRRRGCVKRLPSVSESKIIGFVHTVLAVKEFHFTQIYDPVRTVYKHVYLGPGYTVIAFLHPY